ncbi:MAG: organomercurial lyase MerB [Pseudonocardia sp.]|nr:organomercurial lyase MerB [Pseudonocardia sp.]
MATRTDRIAAATVHAVFGTENTENTENTASDPAGTRLLRTALRLLAHGEPISVTELAAAAGVPDPDLTNAPAGRDIEYDQHGRIVGWGLTLNPTPHRFTIGGRRLYTYCAPDTLIFPVVIGEVAHIESDCPNTGTTIRLTLDPTEGVTGLDPAGAVVTIVDPTHIDRQRVRATLCDPQRFFATGRDAHDWQAHNPGMTVLPVADAYTQIALPIAWATLGHPSSTRPCSPHSITPG